MKYAKYVIKGKSSEEHRHKMSGCKNRCIFIIFITEIHDISSIIFHTHCLSFSSLSKLLLLRESLQDPRIMFLFELTLMLYTM